MWLLLTRLPVAAVTPEHKNLINIHLTPDPRWLRGAGSYWGHYNSYTVVSRTVNQVRVVSECLKKAPTREACGQ